MAIGYYFKEYKVFEKFGINKALIFAIAVVIFWITGNANECVNLCDAVYSDIVLFIMAAMSGRGYIAQVNIPFIICVLAMMIIMAIEIVGVWGYGKLKGQ